MAYPRPDQLPSTAPVRPRLAARPRAIAVPARRAGSKLPVRLFLGLIVLLLFSIPGYLAASATESLAIGILAADFAFLLTVAGWSSVAGGARR